MDLFLWHGFFFCVWFSFLMSVCRFAQQKPNNTISKRRRKDQVFRHQNCTHTLFFHPPFNYSSISCFTFYFHPQTKKCAQIRNKNTHENEKINPKRNKHIICKPRIPKQKAMIKSMTYYEKQPFYFVKNATLCLCYPIVQKNKRV